MLEKLLQSPLPRIEEATVLLFHLGLKSPFETSFGSIDHREIILCEIKADGLRAYGECAADEDPLYSYETTFTCWEIFKRYLLPALGSADSIGSYLKSSSQFRGHNMAKATIEAALWDLLAQSQNKPLFRLWGRTKNKIPCGVS